MLLFGTQTVQVYLVTAPEYAVTSDLYGFCGLNRDIISAYPLWTAGQCFSEVKSMPPCTRVAMFTKRGDAGPRTAPRCWVKMGLAHDGGFVAGWARYMAWQRAVGGGVSYLG